MARIGNVTEINAVKEQLNQLKERGIVQEWELPYEHILTRLSASIFFMTPSKEENTEDIWKELGNNALFQYRLNDEKNLSQLAWRLEYNKGQEA